MIIVKIILTIIILWLAIGCVLLYYTTHHIGSHKKYTKEEEEMIDEYMKNKRI